MQDLSITAAGSLDAASTAQRLHRAAQQFEQQFAAQILKPLSDDDDADNPFGGGDPGDKVFKGMMVDGLAEHAAGGMGIARLIEQELAGRIRTKAPPHG